MSVRLGWPQLWTLLRSLPAIRFVLMLGGGVVATGFLAWIQGWLLHGRFPAAEAVWIERIKGAVALGLFCCAIILVVMVALAFGKVGRLKINGPGGVGGELDFDNDPEGGTDGP